MLPSLERPSLFAEVASFENLLRAYQWAARGKRSRPNVCDFDYHLEWHLLHLQYTLAHQTYRPGGYRRFTIADPKPRHISAAPFRDRVVHHALCRIITPLFERRFIADSYANRVGKGIHAALDRCTQFARRYPYVLRCDLVQFFPAVDLAILRRTLARVIRDDQVLWLCDQIMQGGQNELRDHYNLVLYPGDDPAQAAARPRGLPIGNQTSQFWANCYLNPLDQFVKSELRIPGYLRYVDDFLLFANYKATLHHAKRELIAFLASKLRMSLHEAESNVNPVTTGIPFLGFRVFPDHRLLRRRNGVAFARRWRHLVAGYQQGTIDAATIHARLRGWIAHVSHGDTWGLRRAILSPPRQGAANA